MAGLIAALRVGKKELQHASELGEYVKTRLAEIRANSDLDENAQRITTLSSMIDKSLAKTRRHAESFQGAVAETRADFAGLETRVRRQTAIVAVLITVILVWIAIAQLSLAVHGWRALHLRPPHSKHTPAAD